MASIQRVVIVDDLDGSTQDVEAVWIGLEEDLYEVDLNPAHRQQLMAVLGPFIARARLLVDESAGEDEEEGTEGVEEEPPLRPRSQRPTKRPAKARHRKAPRTVPRASSRAVPRAQAVSPAALYEHPDYPWFPFHRVERTLGAKVRAWAVEQGIVMPDRGMPRSVLRAYYRRDLRGATSAGGRSSR